MQSALVSSYTRCLLGEHLRLPYAANRLATNFIFFLARWTKNSQALNVVTNKNPMSDSYSFTTWWFQPISNLLVNLDHETPKDRSENKTCLKPTIEFSIIYLQISYTNLTLWPFAVRSVSSPPGFVRFYGRFTSLIFQSNNSWWFRPLWKILVKLGIFHK